MTLKNAFLFLGLVCSLAAGCSLFHHPPKNPPPSNTDSGPTAEEIERIRRQNEAVEKQIEARRQQIAQLEKERGKTNGLGDEELRRKLDETNKRITFIRGEIEALLKQIKPLTPYYRDPGR